MLEAAIQSLTARLGEVNFTLFSMYPDEDAARNPFPNLEIVAADARQLGVIDQHPRSRVSDAALPASSAASALSRDRRPGGIGGSAGPGGHHVHGRAGEVSAVQRCFDPACLQCRYPGRQMRAGDRALSAPDQPNGCPGLPPEGSNDRHPRAGDPRVRGRVSGCPISSRAPTSPSHWNSPAPSMRRSRSRSTCRSSMVTWWVCARASCCRRGSTARGGDYPAQIVELIEHLRAQGKRVLLIPHSVRTGTRADPQQRHAALPGHPRPVAAGR